MGLSPSDPTLPDNHLLYSILPGVDRLPILRLRAHILVSFNATFLPGCLAYFANKYVPTAHNKIAA